MKMEMTIPADLVSAIADEVVARLRPVLTGLKMKSPQVDDLMGLAELGKYLGVSKDWIYRRTACNEIPFVNVGHLIKFRRSDIDQWLVKQSAPSVAPLSARLPSRRVRDSKSREPQKNHLKSNCLQEGVK